MKNQQKEFNDMIKLAKKMQDWSIKIIRSEINKEESLNIIINMLAVLIKIFEDTCLIIGKNNLFIKTFNQEKHIDDKETSYEIRLLELLTIKYRSSLEMLIKLVNILQYKGKEQEQEIMSYKANILVRNNSYSNKLNELKLALSKLNSKGVQNLDKSYILSDDEIKENKSYIDNAKKINFKDYNNISNLCKKLKNPAFLDGIGVFLYYEYSYISRLIHESFENIININGVRTYLPQGYLGKKIVINYLFIFYAVLTTLINNYKLNNIEEQEKLRKIRDKYLELTKII